ncbi:Protein PHR1-LIKE 1 [Dendrobium catenatum]|uniref:Protein PHR1-LIKE 1 n=1 Tax=Dendrobium catenatum TaxID=906689 RepID=A0A2I0WJ44_9ASPA|nr:Protein PHR1-LIKE 1 [Dendrobium catenatum]
MGSLMAELGLDLKLFTKKTIGCFLKNEMKLKDFVGLLEEERQKIEAFKRELPLCMILVNDVIDELKLEAEQCQGGDGVIEEEFIPLKARSDEEDKEDQKDVKLEKDNMEKMDWMSSVQLWNDNCSDESVNFKKDSHKIRIKSGVWQQQNGDAVSLESKSRSAGIGAFLPLKVILTRNEEKTLSISLPDLPTAISAPTATTSAVASDNRIIGQSAPSTSAGSAYLVLQAQRKARRCWSPELHRRFVMALQQLGGAQVATPKQIRELMMVDGLTNDEVKSHLQKDQYTSDSPADHPFDQILFPCFRNTDCIHEECPVLQRLKRTKQSPWLEACGLLRIKARSLNKVLLSLVHRKDPFSWPALHKLFLQREEIAAKMMEDQKAIAGNDWISSFID